MIMLHLSKLLIFIATIQATIGFHIPSAQSAAIRHTNSCANNCDISILLKSTTLTKKTTQSKRHQFNLFQSLDEETYSSDNASIVTKSFSTPLDQPILASLDFLSFMIFAAIGKASHSADGSLDIGAVTTTAFPFLLSWFATSPLTGIYNDDDYDGEKNELFDAAKVTLKGWILAVPLGCVGRGLIKGYVPPLPFVIVTLISTLVILTVVRSLYSLVEGKINQE